jgi:malate dehydrogenase (oxaloacetate-decarboxylating)
MVKAAALALVELSPTRRDKQAALLPPLNTIRAVSQEVARAVGKQAIKDGLAQVDTAGLEKELAANIWQPVYEPYEYSGTRLAQPALRLGHAQTMLHSKEGHELPAHRTG